MFEQSKRGLSHFQNSKACKKQNTSFKYEFSTIIHIKFYLETNKISQFCTNNLDLKLKMNSNIQKVRTFLVRTRRKCSNTNPSMNILLNYFKHRR